MAWLPSLRGLTLLLPLLSPFWTPTRAGDRKVAVLAPREVHGSRGDTVNLMCNLLPMESKIPKVKQIRWERLEPWGELTTVAEFDWARGPRILEPDRVQFVAARKDQDLLDASLMLTELHPDDDANYTCEVTTFQHGSGRASTWLRVFYAPQVSISQYDDTRQSGYRDIRLSCDARGNPEPEGYKWSTTTGPLPPSAVPQGSWLLLQPSEESMDTTFICFVFNALGTAHVTMRVLLPGSSKKHSLPFLILPIVLPIVGLMAMVLVVLIYFQCSRKSPVLRSALPGTCRERVLGAREDLETPGLQLSCDKPPQDLLTLASFQSAPLHQNTTGRCQLGVPEATPGFVWTGRTRNLAGLCQFFTKALWDLVCQGKSTAGSDPGETNLGFLFLKSSTDPFSRTPHDNPTGQPSSASVARESTGVTVELRQDN